MTSTTKSKRSSQTLTKSSTSSKPVSDKKSTDKAQTSASTSREAAAKKRARMQRDALTAYVKGNDLVLLPGKKLTYLSPRSK